MQKIKVQWTTREHDIVGNALGYNHHNSSMKKFCEEYFEYSDDADIAVSICPADLFVPVPGKLNVLFTMWEFLELPNKYIQRINRADVLVVPCSFCRDLFSPAFNGPIYVCHEGVDENIYKFKQRSLPRVNMGEKFRFLWVGAPNPRKGYQLVIEVLKVLENNPHVEIYMKTTTPKLNRKEYVPKLWKNRRKLRQENHAQYKEMLKRAKNPDNADKVIVLGKHNNVVWDSRRLPLPELINLYESSHCFLFPTFGEGWGLTLCEALATGIPSIATPVTGCRDYFDDSVGYEINYKVVSQQLLNYEMIAEGYCPDVNDLLRKMLMVMSNYSAALKKGQKASSRILNKFTWKQSAQRFYQIIQDVKAKKMEGCYV